MNQVPDWITQCIDEARGVFGVGAEWYVEVKMMDNPGGDGDNDGACRADAVYLNATLEFARDLEEGERGRRVIFHEVGHIALAQLNLAVGYILSGIFDESQREIFRKIYDDAEEQVLQRFTRAMSANRRVGNLEK